ncbi:hypothetical protein M153_16400011466 [Pseudoloma neurophilia]|uniref:Uncharacterized protein n=1 Tax=Pseudoloma neurophilia TaxID=146866 RepID=A0A0R0M8Q0_9MICR|nr:hypothetical protein M153_16400011466 [Pseudoloma neurophilia]
MESDFDFLYHCYVEKDIQAAFDTIYFQNKIDQVKIDRSVCKYDGKSFMKRNLVSKSKTICKFSED